VVIKTIREVPVCAP